MSTSRHRDIVDKLKDKLEARKYDNTIFVSHDEAIEKALELAMYLMAVELERHDSRA